jgi:hypothetical protein
MQATSVQVSTYMGKVLSIIYFVVPNQQDLNILSAIGLQNPVDSAHGDSIVNMENITSNSWTSINHNSSLLGPRTMQWVHMVCGLWTPGTKCPNAATMSAFDVSGASPAKRNTVSSIHAYSYDNLME